MSIGSFNYQVLTVESWNGSGNAQLTVSKSSNSTT
jgi:hypothetical protein